MNFVVTDNLRVCRREFTEKIKVIQTRLDDVVSNNLESQLHGINEKIGNSIGPYSRFVRVETKKNTELSERLKKLKSSISEIRSHIR